MSRLKLKLQLFNLSGFQVTTHYLEPTSRRIFWTPNIKAGLKNYYFGAAHSVSKLYLLCVNQKSSFYGENDVRYQIGRREEFMRAPPNHDLNVERLVSNPVRSAQAGLGSGRAEPGR